MGVSSPHKISPSPCPVATVADPCPLVIIRNLLASCVASSLVQQTFSRPMLSRLTEILFVGVQLPPNSWFRAVWLLPLVCHQTKPSDSCSTVPSSFNGLVRIQHWRVFLVLQLFFNMSGWPPVLHVTVSYGIGVDHSNGQVLFYPVQSPRREAGDVWCLPPVWNFRAVIWFLFPISSLVFFCLILLLFLSCHFSANGPFSWLFFPENSQIVFVKD